MTHRFERIEAKLDRVLECLIGDGEEKQGLSGRIVPLEQWRSECLARMQERARTVKNWVLTVASGLILLSASSVLSYMSGKYSAKNVAVPSAKEVGHDAK
jgi:phage protein U